MFCIGCDYADVGCKCLFSFYDWWGRRPGRGRRKRMNFLPIVSAYCKKISRKARPLSGFLLVFCHFCWKISRRSEIKSKLLQFIWMNGKKLGHNCGILYASRFLVQSKYGFHAMHAVNPLHSAFALETDNECICCESLLLSFWNFCRDRLQKVF